MSRKSWKEFLKLLYTRFKDDEITALSAQLTFYLILAFFPFLIALITIITYTPLVTEESLYTLSDLLPLETYYMVMDVVLEVVYERSLTLLSFGMIGALWAASNGVAAVLRGINKSYDQKETRPFWILRGLALLFTFGLVVVILSALVLLVLGKTWITYGFESLGFSEYFIRIWQWIRYGISFAIMWLTFTALYRYAPNKRIQFKDVIAGSTFAIIGWLGISFLFAYYFNHFGNFSYMYGSIGGVFLLLIWLYISSIIVLLGAEINAILYDNKEKFD
ncbi:YihY/virulence factor BrkB family protein [Alkaliphilus hydrothermalis]|uniref:Membrane protein n=1 Tax=Alkaliphilus hydrothermalis TaxID=1482730 RepID=A0ABS2NQ30_9FIRM|nr:YihY/virulence factor BrkB family protein [Alkaliphilus hydrothermalis]MBM7615068.1 membrane protein [Alkaliphilus hydrothermalis]